MSRLYVLCEGQTEETFVKEMLAPELQEAFLDVRPIVLTTSRTPERKFKGGVSTFQKIRRELDRLCRQDRQARVTTMIDLYRLPTDTPSFLETRGLPPERRAQALEAAIRNDLGHENLIPYLSVHEFEALLFSRPEAFRGQFEGQLGLEGRIAELASLYDNPEQINGGEETSPSKRIRKLVPSYEKVLEGNILALEVGLLAMMEKCPHFSSWVLRLKSLH